LHCVGVAEIAAADGCEGIVEFIHQRNTGGDIQVDDIGVGCSRGVFKGSDLLKEFLRLLSFKGSDPLIFLDISHSVDITDC